MTMEERYERTDLANDATFIVFTVPPLSASTATSLCAQIAKGGIALGRGGTEEALRGRYPSVEGAPIQFVSASDVELDEPSPHGEPSAQAWQQALVWYCSCARVGGLVLADDAAAFAAWIQSHAHSEARAAARPHRATFDLEWLRLPPHSARCPATCHR